MRAEDLSEIYREIAETLGVDVAVAMHDLFQGQQVQFPQKLYNKEYTYRRITASYNGHNVRQLAQEFGYSDRRIRQILKKHEIKTKSQEVKSDIKESGNMKSE